MEHFFQQVNVDEKMFLRLMYSLRSRGYALNISTQQKNGFYRALQGGFQLCDTTDGGNDFTWGFNFFHGNEKQVNINTEDTSRRRKNSLSSGIRRFPLK
jgi:hypothetical protein